MKSVNKGSAETGAVLAGTGAMPVITRGHAGGGEDLGRGGDAVGRQQAAWVPLRQLERLLETSETEHPSIAQPDGNRRTARFMRGLGSDACVNGGADAYPTRGR
jgi:hypothetical protein